MSEKYAGTFISIKHADTEGNVGRSTRVSSTKNPASPVKKLEPHARLVVADRTGTHRDRYKTQ